MGARYAAFIDGGYLKAAGAAALKRRTHCVQVDAQSLMRWVRDFRAYGADGDLLRAYWYDGAFDGSDPRSQEQKKYFDVLDATPGLEVRLGFLVERTPKWHRPLKQALKKCGVEMTEFSKHFQLRPDVTQKGVDALITLDLVHHSDRRSYDWALLVAGDRDLVEAVRNVQNDGRHVVVAVPQGAGLAPELRRRADQLRVIDLTTLERILVDRPVAAACD